MRDIFRKYNQIGNIKAILSWDSSAKMPQLGYKNREQQMLLLTEYGQSVLERNRVEYLLSEASDENLNEWDSANLECISHYVAHKFAVPDELQSKFMKAGLECEFMWRKARAENDFKSFAPKLEIVVSYVREIAKLKAEKLGLGMYDALLDQYEPGLRVADFAPIFSRLKEELPGLISAIQNVQRKPAHNLNEIAIPIDLQRKLCVSLSRKIGLPEAGSRIDEAVHPFCGGYKNDVRITTRYSEKGFLESLMGVIHETGHGMYENNLPEAHSLDLVGQALGMAVHESQSLFYEMQLGRSQEFCQFLSQQFTPHFQDKPEIVSAQNLFVNQNQVKPDLIRVNADEVTYPLHVILRYELEESLIKQEIEVADLPEIWGQKMAEYLGVNVPDNKDGCMQDCHWTDGSFGYFPTYTLGAIIAANIREKAKRGIVNLDGDIAKGKFTQVNEFLKTNLHQHGSSLSAKERIEKVCGNFLDADIYLNYLRSKYLN